MEKLKPNKTMPRYTPNQMKNWLRRPARGGEETQIKLRILEYIYDLENVVALYTERDGRIKNG